MQAERHEVYGQTDVTIEAGRISGPAGGQGSSGSTGDSQ